MKKILFACDMDNTLIYSKKHPHEGWPCVEWIHEKEQGYQSPKTGELLEKLADRVRIVPVTSRSVEQYERIHWPGNTKPRWAVTTHGARLLTEAGEDEDWRRETDAVIAPWMEELRRMEGLLAPDPSFIRCRMVDDAYLFVYCAGDTDPEATRNRIRAMTGLTVSLSGKKIYLLPPELNKGTAVERLRKRFPGEFLVAAGDGEMDLDMLNRADLAPVPEAIADRVVSPKSVCPRDTLFSDFVMESLENMLRS